MNVAQALEQRKSTRAFLDKPVSKAQVTRILQAARHAPSGTNTQPWQVAVISGKVKKQLDDKLKQAFLENGEQAMDYDYYPDQWVEPYKGRRRHTGKLLYSTLEIERGDSEKQQQQWLKNYEAFGAPVVLFFFLDKVMKTGSFMDYGMFLQSVMLMAESEGLATCPQAALGQGSHIVKQALNYPEESYLLCGLALGYEDKEHIVNSYRTPRLEVDEFARFMMDDDA